jgi:hypothetical protein
MKSSVFWDITPCNLVTINQHFGGIYRLHLQGSVSQARNKHDAGSKLFNPEDGGDMFLQNMS